MSSVDNDDVVLGAGQSRVLDFVLAHHERTGRFPSGIEVARQLGYHPSSVYRHFAALADKGFLTVETRGGWRRFSLASARPGGAGYPRLGRIPAGPLTALEEARDGDIRRIEDLLPSLRPGDFFVEVDGDSMVGAGLHEGMLVALRPDMTPRPGAICAVWVEPDGGTLKHVYVHGNRVRLVAANPKYAPQEVHVDQVRIQGVLVGAIDVRVFL